MPILSKDPRNIHPAYKEAVVDSLLNGLSARLAGRGDFYRVIYGAKPSAALMSEFIVPMPLEERGGDEEADPIRISAHGMDFQVRSAAIGSKLNVSLTGAVYVRILPTEDEVKPGGRLEATFPLTREARADIRAKVKDALGKLAAELPGGKTHPEWAAKSYDARKTVYESMGLPFNNRLDRAPVDRDAETEDAEVENGEGAEGEARPAQEVIAMGINGLEDFLDAHPELRQRFERRVYLDDPEVTSADDVRDMRKLLAAMNAVVPCAADCELATQDMLVRVLLAAECRFGSVINLVRSACAFGAMDRQPQVTLENFCSAYREVAPRNKRKPEDNPFLMPIETAKNLVKQIQSRRTRPQPTS